MSTCYRKVGNRYYSPSEYRKLKSGTKRRKEYLAFNDFNDDEDPREWEQCECGYYKVKGKTKCKYCGR